MKPLYLTSLVMALTFAGVAVAQEGTHHSHQSRAAAVGESPAVEGYRAASEKMHRDMGSTYSGDADLDFARGMIPHHQGAIDMARVVLQHGKSFEIRKLAQEIIAAQEKEIAFLQEWIKSQAK